MEGKGELLSATERAPHSLSPTYQLRGVPSRLQNQLVTPLFNFKTHFLKEGRVCQPLRLHLCDQVLILAVVFREVSDGIHCPLGQNWERSKGICRRKFLF